VLVERRSDVAALVDGHDLVDEPVDGVVLRDRFAALGVPAAVQGVEGDPLEDEGVVGVGGAGGFELFDALESGAAAVDAYANFGVVVGFGEAVFGGFPAATEEVDGPGTWVCVRIKRVDITHLPERARFLRRTSALSCSLTATTPHRMFPHTGHSHGSCSSGRHSWCVH